MQIMRVETRSGEQKISTLVTEMAKFMPEELANVRDRSRVMVTCYPPGSRYTRHVDNGGGISNVSRPFSSWSWSILTEIYLGHACSCQEILRTETAGQGRRLTTLLCAPTSPPLVSPHLRFARFFSQPHETARPSSFVHSAIT
jgi:hypothetical protein